MRIPSILFVSAAVAGLAGCHSQDVDDRAGERLSQVRVSAERSAVYPTCRDRSTIAANCGLILKHAATEDFRTKFRDRKCVGKDEAACETLYQTMLDGWLAQRYVLADWRQVTLLCNSDPERCDDPVAYELLLVDSHNFKNRDNYAAAEKEIDHEREREQRRHGRAVAGVAIGLGVAAVAVASRRGPTCRSYPSAFSGVTTTVCTR